jgi:uncharacterized membrane protein
MTTFTVWKFATQDGAEQASSIVKDAEADRLVKVLDHAVVSWPQGASHPTTKHSHDENVRGAGWGALWGLLGGALFFVPLIGGAIGAAVGALAKSTDGTGITKQDLETIRTEVTEGTSALFLVTDEGDLDRLGDRLHGLDKKLIHTNLTEAERSVLLETFGGS